MTISSTVITSCDKAMHCMKGVGAEGGYVKNRFRRDEIRFIMLSYRRYGELSGVCFTKPLMIACHSCHFFIYKTWQKKLLQNGRRKIKCKFATILTQTKREI